MLKLLLLLLVAQPILSAKDDTQKPPSPYGILPQPLDLEECGTGLQSCKDFVNQCNTSNNPTELAKCSCGRNVCYKLECNKRTKAIVDNTPRLSNGRKTSIDGTYLADYCFTREKIFKHKN
ncbi:uncharacterized protein LOC132200276 [Neocloeon triangulifer]|uniref:uncharacterized protein LOC132200276 n=1 Tax=Neocloeon triangulifer TaxID=2078957 RepID=UPI00286F291B|nr:uncharacterized protein LOC132200276 [Neocloeon triangulifer]